MAFAGDGVDSRTPEQTAVALMAAARGYHRREDKPFWWAHFDRLNNPVDEWGDTSDVFLAEKAEVVKDWHLPSSRARKNQRWVKLTGALEAGGLKGEVFALYNPPSPAGLADNPDRRAAGNAEITVVDDPSLPTEVTICEREPADGPFTQLPFALTPRSIVRDEKAARVHRCGGGRSRRSPTRTARHRDRRHPVAPNPAYPQRRTVAAHRRHPRGHHCRAAGPRRLVCRRARPTRHRQDLYGGTDHRGAGQRPPVAGRRRRAVTRGGGEPVPRPDQGRRRPGRIAKKDSPADAAWQVIDKDDYAAFIATNRGCVIGGTAWDFANDNRVAAASLELLVIEEAGQFCLANTIAVARAAKNLMLLGDPQQLPQVSQGHHPEPVDASALGWLVQGHRTLPEELGYFLDRSYRMHPAVCGPVSRLSYEGRLRSEEPLTAARRLDGNPPGVRMLAVPHDGNSTSSPEEAAAIVAEIGRVIGTDWTDEDGTRRLRQDDVLVVAPYNAQVLLLREHLVAAGLDGVDVGTVDKFQGRQAPVVFISMTASSIDDVPRGIAFLLNRNRLNVAVSRAKYASVIVRSESLTEYLPSTPDRLIELGAFLSLAPCDTPTG